MSGNEERSGGTTFEAPLRVVDEQGRVIFAVENEQSRPRVQLFNERGTPVVTLGVGDLGGMVSVYTHAGQLVATLVVGAQPGAGGVVGVHNREGEARALLFADENGGHLGASGPEGLHAVVLGGSPLGGQIDLFDREGNRTAPERIGAPPAELGGAGDLNDVPESFSDFPGATAHHS